MIRRSSLRTLPALAALGVLVACSSGVGNGTPRIGEIPTQFRPGSAVAAVDLAPYVTDREGEALTFDVVSGGGGFTGSVYSHTFPTMGRYTVVFRVTDAPGNAAEGHFDVVVTSANFAAVQESGSGLLLLDTFSDEMVPVAAGASQPRFEAGLADGRLVFARGTGATQLLSVFDPFTRTNRLCTSANAGNVTFAATTSDGRIVLTTGAPPDTDLYVFNPRTNLLSEVSAVAGETDGHPLVNAADLVFYERGNGGQADIYCYDPDTDSSSAVSADANDERLQAVLANGAVVFSRVGAGGETDLHYFHQGTGLVEIGLDIAALGARTKAFGGGGSGGQVVFTAVDGADIDLFVWDPASGVTTPIATGGVYGVEGIGAGNEVVYRHEVGAGVHDLLFYDLDDGATGTVHAAGDVGNVLAVTRGAGIAWAIVQGSGATGSISAVSLVPGPTTVTWAAGGAVALGGLLRNGDAVAQRGDGTALARFAAAAGTWGAPLAGTGLLFGGDGLDDGDFVYQLTVGGQTDLSMWDASAGSAVVVSDAAGDDVFQAATYDGTLLFARTTAGNGNSDLFAWDPVNGERRITDSAGTTLTYSVSGCYQAAR